MTYFERRRRRYIVVSPDFPLDEAIETGPSRVKPEPPPPNQPVLSKIEGPAPPPEGRGFNPAVAELSRVEGKEAIRSARRPAPSGRPDPSRHERKCRVCSHPDRDAIEEAFIHWHSPTLIAQDYQISDDSLYRHAYATGLDALRSRNLRCALERILEKAQRVVPTADSIVRAVRAYTRINDAGEWVEPPMHVIVSSGSAFPLAESQVTSLVTDRPSRPSNRGIRELENGSTR